MNNINRIIAICLPIFLFCLFAPFAVRADSCGDLIPNSSCKFTCGPGETTSTSAVPQDCGSSGGVCCIAAECSGTCRAQGGCDKATEIEQAGMNCPGGEVCCAPQPTKSGGTSGAKPVMPPTVSLKNPLSIGEQPTAIISTVVKSFIGLVGGLSLLMMIWGAFQWLTSAGNTDRVSKGTKTMIWAAIGLTLVLSSYLLLTTIVKYLSGGK